MMSTFRHTSLRGRDAAAVTWVLCLLLQDAGTGRATPYRNPEIPYTLELPGGWTMEGSGREIKIVTSKFSGVEVEIRAASRPDAMNSTEAKKLAALAMKAVVKRSVAQKGKLLDPFQIDGKKCLHYGIFYREKTDSPVRVMRAIFNSWPLSQGNVWFKFTAQFNHGDMETAGAEIDSLLRSFTFQSGLPEGETPTNVGENPGTITILPKDAQHRTPSTSGDSGSDTGYDRDESPEGSAFSERVDDDRAAAFFSRARKVSGDRAQQMRKAFAATSGDRDEAARARARQMTGMDALSK